MNVRAQKAHQHYERALDRGDDELADEALKRAVAFEAEERHLAEVIAAAEHRLEDWPTAPEVDRLLDFYNELQAAIAGRVAGSQTVAEMNATLRSLLAEARLSYVAQRNEVRGQFKLRVTDAVLAGRTPELVELVNRPTFYGYRKANHDDAPQLTESDASIEEETLPFSAQVHLARMRQTGATADVIATPGETGHNVSRLWPPAAAISSARFASSWPRTSARSSAVSSRRGTGRAGETGSGSQRPCSMSASRASEGMPLTDTPSTSAASGAFAIGHEEPRVAGRSRSQRGRQRATNRADLPGEG